MVEILRRDFRVELKRKKPISNKICLKIICWTAAEVIATAAHNSLRSDMDMHKISDSTQAMTIKPDGTIVNPVPIIVKQVDNHLLCPILAETCLHKHNRVPFPFMKAIILI